MELFREYTQVMRTRKRLDAAFQARTLSKEWKVMSRHARAEAIRGHQSEVDAATPLLHKLLKLNSEQVGEHVHIATSNALEAGGITSKELVRKCKKLVRRAVAKAAVKQHSESLLSLFGNDATGVLQTLPFPEEKDIGTFEIKDAVVGFRGGRFTGLEMA